MSDKRAAWILGLSADELKGEAVSAGKALQGLRTEMKGDVAEIGRLDKAIKNLKLGDVVDLGAVKQLEDQKKALKNSVAAGQSTELALVKNMSQVGIATRGAGGAAKYSREWFDKLFESGARLGGPLGALSGRAAGLTKILGSQSAGLIGLGVGFAAVSVAGLYAAHSIYDVAPAASEAKRAELGLLVGAASTQQGLTDFAGAGKLAQSAIENVARHSSLAKAQVSEYGADLLRAGVSGDKLSMVLRGVATVSAVQGDAAAKEWSKQAVAIAAAKGDVDAFARKVDERIGQQAADAMLSGSVAAMKLHENVQGMFADVNLTKLDSAKLQLARLFDETTATGAKLKGWATDISQSLVDSVAGFVKNVSRGFAYAVLASTELENAWLKLSIAMHDVLPKGLRDAFSSLGDAFDPVNLGIGLLGAAAIAATPPMFTFAAAVIGATWPFALAAGAIMLGVNAVRLLYDALIEVWPVMKDWAREAKGWGANLIKGLVTGIEDGIQWIAEAMLKVGDKIKSTITGLFGIHSPSTVFAGYGENLIAGMREGIDAQRAGLNRDLQGLIEQPELAADVRVGSDADMRRAAHSGGATPVAGGEQTNFVEVHVHVAGTSVTPREMADAGERAVVEAFRKLARQRGVA